MMIPLIALYLITVPLAYALAYGTSSSIGTDTAAGVRVVLRRDRVNFRYSLAVAPFGPITIFAVWLTYLVMRGGGVFIRPRLRWR